MCQPRVQFQYCAARGAECPCARFTPRAADDSCQDACRHKTVLPNDRQTGHRWTVEKFGVGPRTRRARTIVGEDFPHSVLRAARAIPVARCWFPEVRWWRDALLNCVRSAGFVCLVTQVAFRRRSGRAPHRSSTRTKGRRRRRHKRGRSRPAARLDRRVPGYRTRRPWRRSS